MQKSDVPILLEIASWIVDKPGMRRLSHVPSLSNLSRISLEYMLGFVSLNSSIDSRTSSESLEEHVRPPWLKASYVPYVS